MIFLFPRWDMLIPWRVLFVLINMVILPLPPNFFVSIVRRYGMFRAPILESIPTTRVTPCHLPLQSSIGAIPLDTTMSRCQNFSSRFICLCDFVHLWWDLCWHGYNAVGELGCLDGIFPCAFRWRRCCDVTLFVFHCVYSIGIKNCEMKKEKTTICEDWFWPKKTCIIWIICCFIPCVLLPFPRKLRWQWRNAVIWFCCPVSVGRMKMKSVVLEAQRSHTHWTLIWWCHGGQCVAGNKKNKAHNWSCDIFAGVSLIATMYKIQLHIYILYYIYLLFYIVAPWLI